jgi:hypothetical protein
VKSGAELAINSHAASMQNFSRVAAFAGGGFLVVWNTVDSAQDGDGGAVKAQLFDAAGAKLGEEFLVNEAAAASQTTPVAATFADGSFVVAWATTDTLQDGSGGAIKARRFSAAGVPQGGEFLVNTTAAGSQSAPSIATLANGNFVVSWDDAGSTDVFARLYSAGGTALGADFRLNTNVAASQNMNDLVALAGGGFVSVWRTTDFNQDGSNESVKGQVFDENGARLGSEFLVNSNTLGIQNDPSIAALAGGGFVATWVTSWSNDDGSSSAIKAQVFGASGAKVGAEFLVNSAAAQAQQEPVATAVDGGGFMIAWMTLDTAQDGNGLALKAQVFDAAGARVGTEFLVNTQVTGNQSVADMATLSDGRVIVTWTDTYADGAANWGIKGQIFAPDLTPPPPANRAPVITSDGGGDAASRTVNENAAVAATVAASDPDGQAVTYAIVGGADAARFTIGVQSGILSFVSAPNFEAPGDAGANNVYDVVVSASDGTLTDTQALAIAVANVNEPIQFTSSNNHITPEGHRGPFTMSAVEPDNPGAVMTYSIAGGVDAALFAIDAATGGVTFKAAPDYEAPADSGRDNIYNVVIGATDGVTSVTEAVTFRVYNMNEAPVFASGPTFLSVAENQTAVVTLSATDPEGAAISYRISGGTDAARFTINAQTGALAFAAAPDFEAPADANRDNVYHVTVAASDGSLSAARSLSVAVGNVNEPLAFTSGGGGDQAAFSVPENQGNVVQLQAVDADGTVPSYFIAGGADAASFEIDPATRTLRFKALPDFEAPRDAGGDNVYQVTVGATDGQHTDHQSISVTVGNVYEGLQFTGPAPAFETQENGTAVGSVSAKGEPDLAISYSIAGGSDAHLFVIDAASGAIRFAAAPDHESPADLGTDNLYELTVRASDGVSAVSRAVTVRVGNTDEAAAIVSYAGAASVGLTVAENGSSAARVAAADPDGDAVVYRIAGGADAALFAIDAATGALTFAAAPDFEAPADTNGDNVYDVEVAASTATSEARQSFAVTVANENEGVAILSDGGGATASVSADENGTAVTVVAAADQDGTAPTYRIDGGSDAHLFVIDAVSGALSFAAAPDHEAPADANGDNVYDVVVSATDGAFTDTQVLAVTVTNVNEGVAITSEGGGASASIAVAENGTAVTTVAARDEDGDPVTYAIAGGADAHRFTIDASSGALAFRSAPDFEAPADANGDNVYDILVSATDGTFTDTQALAVSVTSVNEGLAVTSNGGGASASVAVAENGTAVASVAARDEDRDPVTYAIAGGADALRFTIDAATGALAFRSAPDFEAPGDANGDNVYDVLVSATDGTFVDTQALAVSVENVNESLAITSNGGGASASVPVAENGTAVASVAARDEDGDPVTYAIAGGADALRFTIDAATGALSFAAAPDFEAPADANGDNVYDVLVSASDGTFVDTQALAVSVKNANESLAITSNGGAATASVWVTENGTTVASVAARDEDGDPVIYAIAGGADALRFTIDAVSGALSFAAAPDFEAPGDANGGNVYDVVVSATDGSFVDMQALAVTVTNVNEGVAITSHGGGDAAWLSVSENSRAVATLAAADADGTAPGWSIVGGADAARFTVDAATGLLQFVASPDHEAPGDADGNNVYHVAVQASDGVHADVQTIEVIVQNVRDGVSVTGTAGSDTIGGASASLSLRTTAAEDTVFGRDGHDTILGLGGDDILYGDGGNDTLNGGAGADRLFGGLGKDQFVYNAATESGVAAPDSIADFSRSQGDRINLSAIDANANAALNQAFAFIGAAAFSKVAGQLRFEQAAGSTFVSGDVDGDGAADFSIRLDGLIPLTASDFVL